MKRGFTLIEMLIVLFIVSGSLLIAFPSWKEIQHKQLFEQEQNRLFLFLRRAQMRVAQSQQIWLLIVSKDRVKHTWCLSVQVKAEDRCDCLASAHCGPQNTAIFYYPNSALHSMLISKHVYPKETSRLNGIRDTLETSCFTLQAGNLRVVFSLFNVGSIKLKKHQSLSACETATRY
ncbi:type II secretory pathway, pseudopilin [Pasteurella multocida subsp. multocida OH4807]|nr:type II secretory pathway, pseudopilin [Pasteurella multocida subsp. multocida OH4807]